MPTLEIDAQDFDPPYQAFNGVCTVQVSKLKVIKFAQTVGNAHYSAAFGRTRTALALAAYRAMAIRCVLDFGQLRLQRLASYSALEASEKVNLSYWIGMTIAAIAADEVLGVPRLTHASGGRAGIIGYSNPTSRQLADLVGQDQPGRWHVLEAKGRQSAASAAARKRYKEQAETVSSVNGTPVSTRSYSIAFLQTIIGADLFDPPASPNGGDLRVDMDDLGDGYYRPFREFLDQQPSKIVRNGRVFIVRPITFDPIDNEYVYVGLEDQFLRTSEGIVRTVDDRTMYVGSDGVAVVTSNGPCDL